MNKILPFWIKICQFINLWMGDNNLSQDIIIIIIMNCALKGGNRLNRINFDIVY